MKAIIISQSVLIYAATCLTLAVAHGTEVYVSNLSHLDTSGSASSRIPFGRDINNVVPRIAQQFRTGTNPNGYFLDTVTLAFDNSIGNPMGFTLNLFTAATSATPSSSIGYLTGNSDPDRAGNYTYSASGIILQPSMSYFLVVQGDGIGYGNNQYMWYRANTFAADSNDGWGIGGIWYSLNGGAWTFWGGYAPAAFEINARPIPEPSTVALLLAGIAITMAEKLHWKLEVERGGSTRSAEPDGAANAASPHR